MFTGLITDVGVVEHVARTAAGLQFTVRSAYHDLVEGESIAHDGVCLTVIGREEGRFQVAAITTTLSRTTLGGWTVGRRVNLERAMRTDERLGGHLVQGHVDAVGEVRAVRQEGDARLMDVAVPDEVARLLVPHGSVTLDGVSLTVNALPAPDVLQVSLIDYTLRHTNLGDRRAGDGVNVEGDVIGKYVARMVGPYLAR